MARTSQNRAVGGGFPTKSKGVKTSAKGRKLTGGKPKVGNTRQSKWHGGTM